MEDNRMDTDFRIYDPYLKYEVYLLDDWGAAKYGKFYNWVQKPLRLRGLGAELEIVSLSETSNEKISLGA